MKEPGSFITTVIKAHTVFHTRWSKIFFLLKVSNLKKARRYVLVDKYNSKYGTEAVFSLDGRGGVSTVQHRHGCVHKGHLSMKETPVPPDYERRDPQNMPQQSVCCHCVRLLGAATVQQDAMPSYT